MKKLLIIALFAFMIMILIAAVPVEAQDNTGEATKEETIISSLLLITGIIFIIGLIFEMFDNFLGDNSILTEEEVKELKKYLKENRQPKSKSILFNKEKQKALKNSTKEVIINIDGEIYSTKDKDIKIIDNQIFSNNEKLNEENINMQGKTIEIVGNINNLTTDLSVKCRDIKGNVFAGGKVNCRNVEGNITETKETFSNKE